MCVSLCVWIRGRIYVQFCPRAQPIPLAEYLPLLPSSSMRGSCRSFSYSQTWTALVPTLLSFYYSLLALNDAQRQAARENCSWEFLPLLLASWLLQNSLLNIFFQLCSVSCILSQNAAVLWHFLCCQHGRQHLLHGAIACWTLNAIACYILLVTVQAPARMPELEAPLSITRALSALLGNLNSLLSPAKNGAGIDCRDGY